MLKVKLLSPTLKGPDSPNISIDPSLGLAEFKNHHYFANPGYLWVEYKYDNEQDECQRRCIEAYCLGYLQYYEEHVRGGFKNHYVYFKWSDKNDQLSIYLDPPPKRVRPMPHFDSVGEVFGIDFSKRAAKKNSPESVAPPTASTATTTDPPSPTKPPPPPL